MNESIYINDIDSILQKCESKVLKESKKQTVTSSDNYNTPYVLKSFKSMYNKFLYLKELNNKREIKKTTVTKKLIQSFDELTTNNNDENDENDDTNEEEINSY